MFVEYIIPVSKGGGGERGGGGISGRRLTVNGPALYVRWQGKCSCVLFCKCIQAVAVYVPHSQLFT